MKGPGSSQKMQTRVSGSVHLNSDGAEGETGALESPKLNLLLTLTTVHDKCMDAGDFLWEGADCGRQRDG